MEIIKKYIYAIQRRLPTASKDDITKEITSLIYDELEGKFGKKDEYTNSEVEEVLKEMGHPREVAGRYRGDKQLLIGPEIYPVYKMVLAIAAGSVTLGLVISYIVKIVNQAVTQAATLRVFLMGFGELLSSLFSSLLALVGSITIIFALIQHFGKIGSEDVNIYDDWKPSDLPDLPEEKDRVHRAGPIIAMCFIAFGFAILNYYVAAGNIPFVSSLDSDVVVLPVFSIDALSRYLPFWNLSLGLSFAMQIILFVQGKWSLGTRLFEIGISLLGIAILAAMINGPMIISLQGIIHEFGAQGWMESVNKTYYIVLKVAMGFAIFGVVVDIIKLVVQQARKANV